MALLTLEELAQQILALPAEQRALPVMWYHPPTGGLGPIRDIHLYKSPTIQLTDSRAPVHPDIPVLKMGIV